MSDERRTHDRVPLRMFVDHILNEDARCLCVTENLSSDGLRLSGSPGRGWGRPRHVWLSLPLPDGKPPIRALGELRYEGNSASGKRVRGYRFKYINPRARRRYDAFLAQVA